MAAVLFVRVRPVELSTAVIVASGTAAPVLSYTLPCSETLTTCPTSRTLVIKHASNVHNLQTNPSFARELTKPKLLNPEDRTHSCLSRTIVPSLRFELFLHSPVTPVTI